MAKNFPEGSQLTNKQVLAMFGCIIVWQLLGVSAFWGIWYLIAHKAVVEPYGMCFGLLWVSGGPYVAIRLLHWWYGKEL